TTAFNFATNTDRLPPQNIEVEEQVLGGIMLDPGAIKEVAAELSTKAFFLSSHQTIYEAALDLHNKNRPTDLMSISVWLHDRNQLDNVGGDNKLAQLVDRTVSAVNIDQYAQLLREKHIRRILISAGHKIIDLGYKSHTELPQILNEAREVIFPITDPRQNSEYKLSSKASLKISQVFHPHLAKPLELLSRWFPFPEEVAIHEMIPVAASLVSSESVIIYQKATGRNEPPIVRSALIAEASNRKTAIERIFLSPLNDLQVESLARHDENVSAYEKERKNWDALSPREQKSRRDEEPSAPPPPRLFLYRGGTKESIWEIMENQPGKGILHAPDEILQTVTARGEYNKGKGSDTESSLSGFNGDRGTMLRKGRIVSFKDSCSVTGGIQPNKLLGLMGNDADDSRGEFARLLPCFLDLQEYPMSEDDAELNLSGLLKDIYQKIDRIPATTYYFSTTARQVFRLWHNTKEKERLLHPSPAIRGFIGKLEGYCAKFAMLLHILWEICEDQRCPSPEIPVERVHSAIALAEFYLKQAMKVRQAIGEDEIDPVKTKIIERLKVEGTLTVGKLQSTNQFLRKIPAAQYFRHFQELAAANPDKIRISTTKKGSLQIELVNSEAIFGSFCLAVSDSDSGYAETTVQQAIPPLSVRQRLTVINSSPVDTGVDIGLESNRPSTDDSLSPLSTTVSLTVVETPTIQGVEPLPLSLSLTAKQNGDRIEETSHNFKIGDRVIIDVPGTKNHLNQGVVSSVRPSFILVKPDGEEVREPSYQARELRHIPAPLYYCNSPARVGDKVKSSVDMPRRGINIGMECQRRGGPKNPFWVWMVDVSWIDGKESKEAIEFLELDLGDGDDPSTPNGGDRT
ncbi:DUF3987 domain-containing protein, partial [Argonema galeatum]|uniref:DUF3987 domain-containing protein n=1 Tax=Argonema galeatum TaxID=2942762 RepID=UPI002013B6D1